MIAFTEQVPLAKVHFIVMPKNFEMFPGLSCVKEEHTKLLGHMMVVANQIAKDKKLEDGYRTIINEGKHGVKELPFLQIVVIGGQKLKWTIQGPGVVM